MLCQDRERWSNMCAVAVDEVAQCKERNTCAANRIRLFFVTVQDI